MNTNGLVVEKYSTEYIIVKGDTDPHTIFFNQLGGKKKGIGEWIFPKSRENSVTNYIVSDLAKSRRRIYNACEVIDDGNCLEYDESDEDTEE